MPYDNPTKLKDCLYLTPIHSCGIRTIADLRSRVEDHSDKSELLGSQYEGQGRVVLDTVATSLLASSQMLWSEAKADRLVYFSV
jgi:hypothetical protein